MGKKSNRFNNAIIRMTSSEYDSYQNELSDLKKIERKKISRKIKIARELGNLSDNEDYEQALREQRKLEQRISELESIIKWALIDEEISLPEQICIGCIVNLYDMEFGENLEYTLVSSNESDITKGKISVESPVGKALLGTKKGDLIEVFLNGYTDKYIVKEIIGIDKKYAKATDTGYEKQKIIKNKKRAINDITPKHFLTRVHVFHCSNSNHILEDILCKVKILKRDGRIETCLIPGAYCKNCNKYFILENQFEQYKMKGVLLCKIVEEDFWQGKKSGSAYGKLNKESILHMMGYNVNVIADLSREQRQGILEIAVDEKILSTAEICSHLEWLIRQNKNKEYLSNAKMKWKMDLEYISNYNPSQKRIVKVDDITRKNYH